nr:hypothetical protein [uncultured bacterium]
MSVAQCKQHLEHAGDPCGHGGMSNISFDRPQTAEATRVALLAEDLRQRLEFNRITKRSTSSVRLDVRDVAWSNASLDMHLAKQRRL